MRPDEAVLLLILVPFVLEFTKQAALFLYDLFHGRLGLVLVIGGALLLQGCAAPVALFIASLSPEEEQACQDRERQRIIEGSQPWRFDAIDNETDEVLCHAYDMECHRLLVEQTFEKAKHRGGFPR